MSVAPPSGEAFLADFHRDYPGLTADAFGSLPVVFRGTTFASSYEVLAATVPTTATPTRVLDLACGDGFLLALLAARSQQGLALCGIDMSAAELRAARARVRSDVLLRQSRAQELHFAAGTFDYVLCHLALMLMDDVDKVLHEVRRVLKPGATVAAVVGARPPPSAPLAAFVEILARHPPQGHFAEVRLGDRRFRNPEGIQELMSLVFQSVRIEHISIDRRLTPAELWRWFLNMYDLHLRSEGVRQVAEREFLQAVVTQCGPDGKLDYPETLRYVVALA